MLLSESELIQVRLESGQAPERFLGVAEIAELGLGGSCEVEFEPAVREDRRVDQAQRRGHRPGVEQAFALTEHHRVHPQLNMQAARWPN